MNYVIKIGVVFKETFSPVPDPDGNFCLGECLAQSSEERGRDQNVTQVIVS
jgi:hypothetical protein